MERTVAAPRLEVLVEREAGQPSSRAVTLDGEALRVGTSPQADVAIDDQHVSRFHCVLAREGGRWRVRDTGSLNGTRLGGIVVRDADLPGPECTLELGESRLRI